MPCRCQRLDLQVIHGSNHIQFMASCIPDSSSCRAGAVLSSTRTFLSHVICASDCTHLCVIHGAVLHVLDGQLHTKAWQLQSICRPKLQAGPLHTLAPLQQHRPVDIGKRPISCRSCSLHVLQSYATAWQMTMMITSPRQYRSCEAHPHRHHINDYKSTLKEWRLMRVSSK